MIYGTASLRITDVDLFIYYSESFPNSASLKALGSDKFVSHSSLYQFGEACMEVSVYEMW